MEPELILRQWHNAMRMLHAAHFHASRAFERGNLALGVPIVVISTLVGTAIFATLERSPSTAAQVFVGMLSVASAVLASLQTFLRFAERSERHKNAAVQYGALRRELEEYLLFRTSGALPPQDFIESFRKRWTSLDQEAPTVPAHVLRRVQARQRDTDSQREAIKTAAV